MGKRWGKEKTLSLKEIVAYVAASRINKARFDRRKKDRSWVQKGSTRIPKELRKVSLDLMLEKVRKAFPLVIDHIKQNLKETGRFEWPNLGVLEVYNEPCPKMKFWNSALKTITVAKKARKKVRLKPSLEVIEFINSDVPRRTSG